MADQAARLRQIVGSRKEQKQEETQRETGGADLPRVIAVTSGKGGVGKTNLAVNLSIALGMMGKRVLLIDADLGMANVDVVLGSHARKHLLNLIEEDVTLNDVLVHGPYGLNYIPGGSGIEKARTFSDWEQFCLLQKLAACGDIADIILIDTGAGLGKNVMDFVLAADEVLLVTTPEPTALTDAYAMMKAYSLYAKEKNLKLIVNRVYEPAESRDVVAKLEQTSARFLHMRVSCLGYLYEDRAVQLAVRHQVPFLIDAPDSVAARCVKGLTDSLLYGTQMKVSRGWKGFLQQIFHFPR